MTGDLLTVQATHRLCHPRSSQSHADTLTTRPSPQRPSRSCSLSPRATRQHRPGNACTRLKRCQYCLVCTPGHLGVGRASILPLPAAPHLRKLLHLLVDCSCCSSPSLQEATPKCESIEVRKATDRQQRQLFVVFLVFDGVPALGLSQQAHMGILTTVWSFVSLVMVRSLRSELGYWCCWCCSGQKQLAVKLLQRCQIQA